MPMKGEGTCLSLSLQAETVQDTNILIRMKHEEVVFACVVIAGGKPVHSMMQLSYLLFRSLETSCFESLAS